MQPTILLSRPDPISDEGLFGYIIRILYQNKYKLRWIKSLISLEKGQLRKYDILSINEENLIKLAFLFDKEIEELKKINFKLENGGHKSENNVVKEYVQVMHVATDKLRICSECIKQYGYLRKVWDLFSYTVCHFHRQLLIDVCPNCNCKITFHSMRKYHCNNCDFDLISSPAKYSENVYVSKLIYEKLHLSRRNKDNSNPLESLSLIDLNDVLFFIAKSFPENVDQNVIVTRKYNIAELSEWLTKSYNVFNYFPENYYKFLEDIKIRRRQIIQSSQIGITKDFGELTRKIYKYFDNEDFNFLREGFENYLDIHIQDYISSTFNKSDIFRNKYLTGHQAEKVLGIKIYIIRILINKGVFRGYYEANNRIYNTILLKTDVLEFKKNMIKGIPNLADVLGLDVKGCECLVESSLISPVLSPKEDNASFSIFNRQDTEAIFKKIDSNMKLPKCRNEGAVYSFKEAQMFVREYGKSLKDFIFSLIDGELVPVNINNQSFGFQKYHFDQGSLDLYVKNCVRKKKCTYKRKHGGYLGDKSYVTEKNEDRKYYSIAEAAKKIKVTSYDISHWIKRGYIEAIQVRKNLVLVNKSSLDKFVDNYWTVSFLEVGKGYNKHLAKHLINNGIQPVSGPSVDGYTKYLFVQSDVNMFLDGNFT
ncbi:TniQ family protein [Aneurinibacillus sp. REN35]|uniref:TniQ family protein n=1 Tax=Aneurinibacillus sp. REN35 TaxID=3237286 RepID=UPI003526D38F